MSRFCRLPKSLIYSGYGMRGPYGDFHVSVPSLKAQQITAKAVEATWHTINKAQEQIDLLEQLAETLMLNWKDRDPETGRSLPKKEAGDKT